MVSVKSKYFIKVWGWSNVVLVVFLWLIASFIVGSIFYCSIAISTNYSQSQMEQFLVALSVASLITSLITLWFIILITDSKEDFKKKKFVYIDLKNKVIKNG